MTLAAKITQASPSSKFRIKVILLIALVLIAGVTVLIDKTLSRHPKLNLPVEISKINQTSTELVNSFNSLSCPTYETCYAAGSSVFSQSPVIVKSTDSGRNWTILSIPKKIDVVNSIVCPTATDCMVAVNTFLGLAGYIMYTVNGGLTWTLIALSSKRPLLSSLSCNSTEFCIGSVDVVTNGNILESTSNFGQTWTPIKPLGKDIGLSLEPITYCYARDFCLISGTDSVPNNRLLLKTTLNDLKNYIGFINSQTNTVNYIQLPNYISIVTSISCATSKLCFAVGMADSTIPVIIKTSNDFKTITTVKLPANIGSAANINCNKNLLCLITGGTKTNKSTALNYFAKNNTFNQLNSNLVNVPDITFQTCNKNLSYCIFGGSNQHLTFTAVDIASTTTTSINPIKLAPFVPPKLKRYSSYQKMLIVGDSTATVMAVGFQKNQLNFGYILNDGSIVGCGLVTNSPQRYTGKTLPTASNCYGWQQDYAQSVATTKPSISVLLIGPWDVISRMLNGTFQHVGDPQYNQLFMENLNQAITILSANNSKVVILNSPYFYHGLMSETSLWPQDDPQRVNSLNQLEDQVAAQHPNTVRVIKYGAHISAPNNYMRVVNGVEIRTPDGIHYTYLGSIYESYWLLQQIEKLNWVPSINHAKLKNATSEK